MRRGTDSIESRIWAQDKAGWWKKGDCVILRENMETKCINDSKSAVNQALAHRYITEKPSPIDGFLAGGRHKREDESAADRVREHALAATTVSPPHLFLSKLHFFFAVANIPPRPCSGE